MSHRRNKNVTAVLKKESTKISLAKEKKRATSFNQDLDEKQDFAVCLENPDTIQKAIFHSSRQTRNSKNTNKSRVASDDSVSSSSFSDKISDSDLLVVSEADSCLSERVSPASGDNLSDKQNYLSRCLNNSPFIHSILEGYNKPENSISAIKNKDLPISPSDIKTEFCSEMISPQKTKCNISGENSLVSKENGVPMLYDSAFSATLPDLEVYEPDISDLTLPGTLNAVIDDSKLDIHPDVLCQNALVKHNQTVSKDSSNLENVTDPNNSLSPKKCFMSLVNQLNSVIDSNENFICNQLKITPLVKPVDFSYETDNPFSIVFDITMLKAASDYLKEKSKSQVVSSVLPDVSELEWQNSIVKSSDPILNFNGNDFNQLNSENESEISISSCKTSDIQPDFFDLSTFSENPENISLAQLNWESPVFSQTIVSDTNEFCGVNQCQTSENLESDNIKKCSKAPPKKKRKRCIWDTRKRRCQRKKNVNKCTIPPIDLETSCDTCNESDLDESVDLVPVGLPQKEISFPQVEDTQHNSSSNTTKQQLKKSKPVRQQKIKILPSLLNAELTNENNACDESYSKIEIENSPLKVDIKVNSSKNSTLLVTSESIPTKDSTLPNINKSDMNQNSSDSAQLYKLKRKQNTLNSNDTDSRKQRCKNTTVGNKKTSPMLNIIDPEISCDSQLSNNSLGPRKRMRNQNKVLVTNENWTVNSCYSDKDSTSNLMKKKFQKTCSNNFEESKCSMGTLTNGVDTCEIERNYNADGTLIKDCINLPESSNDTIIVNIDEVNRNNAGVNMFIDDILGVSEIVVESTPETVNSSILPETVDEESRNAISKMSQKSLCIKLERITDLTINKFNKELTTESSSTDKNIYEKLDVTSNNKVCEKSLNLDEIENVQCPLSQLPKKHDASPLKNVVLDKSPNKSDLNTHTRDNITASVILHDSKNVKCIDSKGDSEIIIPKKAAAKTNTKIKSSDASVNNSTSDTYLNNSVSNKKTKSKTHLEPTKKRAPDIKSSEDKDNMLSLNNENVQSQTNSLLATSEFKDFKKPKDPATLKCPKKLKLTKSKTQNAFHTKAKNSLARVSITDSKNTKTSSGCTNLETLNRKKSVSSKTLEKEITNKGNANQVKGNGCIFVDNSNLLNCDTTESPKIGSKISNQPENGMYVEQTCTDAKSAPENNMNLCMFAVDALQEQNDFRDKCDLSTCNTSKKQGSCDKSFLLKATPNIESEVMQLIEPMCSNSILLPKSGEFRGSIAKNTKANHSINNVSSSEVMLHSPQSLSLKDKNESECSKHNVVDQHISRKRDTKAHKSTKEMKDKCKKVAKKIVSKTTVSKSHSEEFPKNKKGGDMSNIAVGIASSEKTCNESPLPPKSNLSKNETVASVKDTGEFCQKILPNLQTHASSPQRSEACSYLTRGCGTMILSVGDEDLDFEPPDHDSDSSDSNISVNTSVSNIQDRKEHFNNIFEAKYRNKFINNVGASDYDMNSAENRALQLQKFFSDIRERDIVSEDESDNDERYDRSFKRPEKLFYLQSTTTTSSTTSTNHESPSECSSVHDEAFKDAVSWNSDSSQQNLASSTVSKLPEEQWSSKKDVSSTIKSNIPRDSLRNVTEVIVQIEDYCHKEMIIEALDTARTYIAISSPVQHKHIVKKVFFSVTASLQNSIGKSAICEAFDNILKLVQDFNICCKSLSTEFIVKCQEHPELSAHLETMFNNCVDKKVPLSADAINAFVSLLKSKEIALSNMLDYLKYVKYVCKKTIPKDLLHLALERSKQCSQGELHAFWKFLYNITSKEVNELNLKQFLLTCFKNSMWPYVAEMFLTWNVKNSLMTSLYYALANEPESLGKYYEKFAEHLEKQEEMSSSKNDEILYHRLKFGQMGISLMMEAFARNQMKNAFNILIFLHKFDVNYFELASSKLRSFKCHSDSFDNQIFPFSVVFVAIDICLYHENPKDAFYIFQDYSWITPDENLNDDVKAYVYKERYRRLLKLVPLLNNENLLHRGWEALKILLISVEKDLALEDLDEKNDGLGSIYNEYLISMINSDAISSVLDLYQHSFGPRKDILTISHSVLRGLVVSFSHHGLTKAAKSVFMQGLLRNVYSIKKPDFGSFPWNLTIRSDWAVPEIKLVVDSFIGTLFPLLSEKPKETKFENWFSVKILFKDSTIDSKLRCLSQTDPDPNCCQNKTKEALLSMNPNLLLTEDKEKNAFFITSDSLYNYWKNIFQDASTKSAQSIRTSLDKKNVRFKFGESVALVQKETEKRTTIQSPSKLHTSSENSGLTKLIVDCRATITRPFYTPVSPETSPFRQPFFHNVSSVLEPEIANTSLASRDVNNSPQKAVDSIIQISAPNRYKDLYENESNSAANSSFYNLGYVNDVHCNNNKASSPKNSLIANQTFETKMPSSAGSEIKHLTPPERPQRKIPSKKARLKMRARVERRSQIEAVLHRELKEVRNSPNSSSDNLNEQSKMPLPAPKVLPFKTPKKVVSAKKIKKVNVSKSFQNFTVSLAPSSSTRIVSSSQNMNMLFQKQNSSQISVNIPTSKCILKTPKLRTQIQKTKVLRHNTALQKTTNIVVKKQQEANIQQLVVKVPTDADLNITEPMTVTSTISTPTDSVPNECVNVLQNKIAKSTVVAPGSSKPVIKRNNASLIGGFKKTETKVIATGMSNPRPVVNQLSVEIKNKKQEEREIKTEVNAAISGSSVVANQLSVKAVASGALSSGPVANQLSAKVGKKEQINVERQKIVFNRTIGKTVPKRTPNVLVSINQPVTNKGQEETSAEKRKITLQNINLSAKTAKPCSGIICSQEEFNKIVRFLETKILQTNRNLSPEDQNRKALRLAHTFIRCNEGIMKLEPKTMKLLMEFANSNV